MKEKELNAFLASVRRTRFVDYLDPLGETAQNALERRLAWARVSQHDPAYAEEARFLLDHADPLREILRGELEQDDWVEEVNVGSEWEGPQGGRRVAESARVTEVFQSDPGGRRADESVSRSAVRAADTGAGRAARTSPADPAARPRKAPTLGAGVVPDVGDHTPASVTGRAPRPIAQASQNARAAAAVDDDPPLVTMDPPRSAERAAPMVIANPRAPDDSGFDDWEDDQMPTGIMQVEDITDPAFQSAFRAATAGPTREILAGTGRVGPVRVDEEFSPVSAPDRGAEADGFDLRTAPSAVTRSRRPTGDTPAGVSRQGPTPAPLERPARTAASNGEKPSPALATTPRMRFTAPTTVREEPRRGRPIAVVALGLAIVVLMVVGGGLLAAPVLFPGDSEVPPADGELAVVEPAPSDPVEVAAAPAPVVEAAAPTPAPVVEPAATQAPAPAPVVEPAPEPEPTRAQPAPVPVAAKPAPAPAPAPEPVAVKPKPAPAPAKPAPAPAPAPVVAAPAPAPAPEPVVAAPKPAPAPEPAVAAVEPEPAAPAAPAMDIQGQWFGTTDAGRSFKFLVSGQTDGSFEGSINMQVEDGSFIDVAVSGSVNADGGVSFRGGDAKFSGKVTGKSAKGSYTLGAASGSWSVVR